MMKGTRAVASASKAALPRSTSTSAAAPILARPFASSSTSRLDHPPPPQPDHQQQQQQQQRPTGRPQPTNLPGSNLPPAANQKYSETTVAIVKSLAKLFGYKSATSTAIRTTSDFYDRCAERGEVEAPFFYEQCMLPPSFQTWFSVTTLHIWLLSVRLRALPDPLGKTYIQEMINHMFIDVEMRIRGPYAVTQGRLIKGYMKDMFEQYRGSTAAYDEGLVMGDAVLAAALWRNLFGAGWGGHDSMGGIKGKRAPKPGHAPSVGPNPLMHPISSSSPSSEREQQQQETGFTVDPLQAKLLKKGESPEKVFKTDEPIVDPKISSTLAASSKQADASGEGLYPQEPDLEFAPTLEKLVRWIRKEVRRLEQLDDEVVEGVKPASPGSSLTDFSRI